MLKPLTTWETIGPDASTARSWLGDRRDACPRRLRPEFFYGHAPRRGASEPSAPRSVQKEIRVERRDLLETWSLDCVRGCADCVAPNGVSNDTPRRRGYSIERAHCVFGRFETGRRPE